MAVMKKILANTAEDPEDLPTSTIIIVAVVCGTIVVVLTIVLIVLCCRRQRFKKKYYEDANNKPAASTSQNNGQLKPALKGIDNPAVDGRDNIDFDDPTTGGVFATNTSHIPNGEQYDPYSMQQHAPVHPPVHPPRTTSPNGYIPRHHAHEPPPAYDDYPPKSTYTDNNPYAHMGRRKEKYPEPTDSFSHHHHHHNPTKLELSKDSSHSGDSGVSTPDNIIKPKKVIHEVIV